MDDFGDDAGPDDTFDASGAALDADAFTIRLHEDLAAQRDDDEFVPWHQLSDEAQEVALTIGRALAAEVLIDPDIDRIAEYASDLREYLSGERPRGRERHRQHDGIEHTVRVLREEGSL